MYVNVYKDMYTYVSIYLCTHLHDPQCTTKKDALRNIRSTVQFKLREIQDSWLSARADEIQGYVEKNDMKTFTAVLRRSTVPPVPALVSFWVQMEPSSYQRRTKSLRGGLSILMVY